MKWTNFAGWRKVKTKRQFSIVLFSKDFNYSPYVTTVNATSELNLYKPIFEPQMLEAVQEQNTG